MKVVNKIILMGVLFFSLGTVAKANEMGIGFATPAPTGLSLKMWFDRTNAFDILGAWSINDEKFYLHANYLTHDFTKFAVPDQAMSFYYGFGARIKEEEANNGEEGDTTLGMRIPFGISYFVQTAPFEVFGEIAPRVDITPSTNFGLDIMIGIRYRINPSNSGNSAPVF